MRDRLRGCRVTCAAAVLGLIAGVAARSELQRRLNGGRRLLPGDPHPPFPDPRWPGSCWCGKAKNAAVHQARIAGSGAAR